MLPASMIIIPEMPLTTNGKLDRPALPAPGVSDPESSRGPRTPQETVLCSLFAEVLGVPQVGIDQNFFLLGGNSLLAAQFISRARQALGAHFTIRDLFEAPVIADLAVHMDGNGKDQSFDTLVPLRKGGDRPPVFCMHPSGGIAWMYIGLAPHINSAHPIYGLQARGITRPAALPDSIEAMAAGYLQRMRTVQPAGPYFLAGWSFGGALAHEVAVQMQDLGEEIAMLAILDAYPPAGTEDAELDEQRILREFLGRLGHERIPERSLEPSELVTALQQFSNPLSGFDEAQIRNLLNVWRHNVRLFQRFAPGHYKGDALLIRATKGRDSAAPDAESWRSHIDGAIETYDIDCEHDDMMEQAALHVIGPVIAAEVERAGSGRLAPAGRPARGARGVN
jgi:nonribosomal peptide synthetase DhbF